MSLAEAILSAFAAFADAATRRKIDSSLRSRTVISQYGSRSLEWRKQSSVFPSRISGQDEMVMVSTQAHSSFFARECERIQNKLEKSDSLKRLIPK